MEELLLWDDPIGVGSDARAHDVLVAVYRNPKMPLHTRIKAAIAAVPFEMPKLQATAVMDGKDFASLLDARMRRYKQLQSTRMVEAQPIKDKPAPEIKPHLPTVHDRRFRRV